MWKKLKAEYDAEKKANTKPVLDASGKPNPQQFEILQVPVEKYAERVMALGRSQDTDTAAAALTFGALEFPTSQLSDQAFDLLLDRFADDGSQLVGFARQQIGRGYTGDYQRTQRLLGVSADPYVRAYSTLKLAFHYLHGDGPASEARAVTLLRRVMADYPAVDGGHAARWAANKLVHLEKMRPGLPTSPLAGQAVDGKPMDLADFKGRVVVLAVGTPENTAWEYNTAWLKEVHVKYAGKPVTVAGLVSLRSESAAEATAAVATMPWRSWLDIRDPKTNEGPVHTTWGILTSPSVIVLDRQGVIRYPELRTREQVEAAVDELLAKK